jgi:hypothetical protein
MMVSAGDRAEKKRPGKRGAYFIERLLWAGNSLDQARMPRSSVGRC